MLINYSLYLWTQWAADKIQLLSTKTAPHQWPKNPNEGWSNSNETCQGKFPSFVKEPEIILEDLLGSRWNVFTPHSVKLQKKILIL